MKVVLGNGNLVFVDYKVKKKHNGNNTTICTIRGAIPGDMGTMGPGDVLATGYAKCCTAHVDKQTGQVVGKDKYNKALGKIIALRRAIEQTDIVDHTITRPLWQRLFEHLQSCPDLTKVPH